MKHYIKILTVLVVIVMVCSAVSCGTVSPESIASASPDQIINTVEPAEATDDMSGHRKFNFKAEDLTWELQNVFSGDHVKNETVMLSLIHI